MQLINPRIELGMLALPAPKAADTRVVVATSQSALVASANTSHAFAAKRLYQLRGEARCDPAFEQGPAGHRRHRLQ